MFADRIDAGVRLAQKLKQFANAPDAVVLGIPRGGVVVAAQVAHALHLPLTVAVAAKVGAPGNPEFAIGAVTAQGDVIENPESGFSRDEVRRYSGPAAEKAAAQLAKYRDVTAPVVVAGRTAIIVDDGLATGLTARAAVMSVRHQGARRIVLAVPVSSTSAAALLSTEVDEFVSVDTPAGFSAVGQFYSRFEQTSDDEVERLLTNP